MTNHTLDRTELIPGVFFNTIRETKFKSNVISLRFILPLSKESAAKNALLFPVLMRGSREFPDLGSIRKEEESIYDTSLSDNVFKRGDLQILEMGMHVLDNRFAIDGMDITARALHLLGNILFHPVTENGVFCEEYVESEKQMLIDDIRAQINDKQRYAKTRLLEEMFEGDVYGISELGTAEDVEAITPETLWAQYKNLLASARLEIFAIGNLDFDALKATVCEWFSHIQRKEICKTETKALTKAKDTAKTVYERQNITQGKLSLGFYTGITAKNPDCHAMQLLNMIYGAGTTSKLFLNVREKLSLCYYCGSYADLTKGYMLVNSGIEFANEKKAFDEIMAQLQEIKNGNISENELRDAKLAMADAAARVSDSAANMLAWYFGGVMNGNVITPEEKRAYIEAVTADDIVRVCENISLDTYYFLCAKEAAQ